MSVRILHIHGDHDNIQGQLQLLFCHGSRNDHIHHIHDHIRGSSHDEDTLVQLRPQQQQLVQLLSFHGSYDDRILHIHDHSHDDYIPHIHHIHGDRIHHSHDGNILVQLQL